MQSPIIHGKGMRSQSFCAAAVGDLHLSGAPADAALVREIVEAANTQADVLILCGDLTCHGRPEELLALVHGARAVEMRGLANGR